MKIELEIEAKSLELRGKNERWLKKIERKEKMNWKGAHWVLYYVFTDRIIDKILNNSIFN
jgi:hypothetical protein